MKPSIRLVSDIPSRTEGKQWYLPLQGLTCGQKVWGWHVKNIPRERDCLCFRLRDRIGYSRFTCLTVGIGSDVRSLKLFRCLDLGNSAQGTSDHRKNPGHNNY